MAKGDLNLIERLVAKAIWSRMEGRMGTLKRYLPLAGTAILAGAVILRLAGLPELAQTIESLGGAIGLSEQSPVGATELAAASVAITGVVLKIRSQIQKARAVA